MILSSLLSSLLVPGIQRGAQVTASPIKKVSFKEEILNLENIIVDTYILQLLFNLVPKE